MVSSLLFIVYCLLFIVYCLLFIVYCLLNFKPFISQLFKYFIKAPILFFTNSTFKETLSNSF